ncbi:Protein of unknown function [Alteromonadaceae bacterium Bs31]|nr:Protein of unknown function [Alteromonadaceae bacterium Bs31]
MSSRNRGGTASVFVFGLVFCSIGAGLLAFGPLADLAVWYAAKSWAPEQARVLDVQLLRRKVENSVIWEVQADYRYQHAGKTYYGARLGIDTGADNAGSWHQDKAYMLKWAKRNGHTITVYVNPKQPEQAIVDRSMRWQHMLGKGMLGAIFAVLGVFVLLWAWSDWSKRRRRLGSPSKLASNGLRTPIGDWQNPVNSKVKRGAWFFTLFAVVWSMLSLPMVLFLPEEIAAGNKAALVALIFPLVGLVLAIVAYRSILQWRRFGRTPLHMKPFPGAIGGECGGTISIPCKLSILGSPSVTLENIYCSASGRGDDRRTCENVVWQREGIAEYSAEGKLTQLQFKFTVPDNLSATEEESDSYHYWRLRVNAQFDKGEFNRDFELPLFRSKQRSSLAINNSAEHPELHNKWERELDVLLNIKRVKHGLYMYFPPFRNVFNNLLLAFIGVIFFTIGVVVHINDTPGVISLVFTLVGLVCFLTGIYLYLNSYDVIVGPRGIASRRKLLGFEIAKKKARADCVKGMFLKKTGSTSSGLTCFAIDALITDGSKIRLAEGLPGRGLAEKALDSLVVLSAYKKIDSE